jgi:hypothetical protein
VNNDLVSLLIDTDYYKASTPTAVPYVQSLLNVGPETFLPHSGPSSGTSLDSCSAFSTDPGNPPHPRRQPCTPPRHTVRLTGRVDTVTLWRAVALCAWPARSCAASHAKLPCAASPLNNKKPFLIRPYNGSLL